MSRFRYGSRLAVALAATALMVSACGGTGGEPSLRNAPAPAAAEPDRASGNKSSYDQAGSGQAAKPGEQGQPAQVKVVPQDRAIIYTAEMTVRAKDVTAAADRARQIVTAAGGHLATEKSDAYSGGEGSAQLVFKIPPAGYAGLLNRLGKELGSRESLQQNTEDVTEQVADVDSRLKSAISALDSLRALLKKADTIGEVLEVEREISSRESDLESLQARRKTLASQTSMATLTLNLVGPATVIAEPEDEPSGFLGGLRTGWKGFVTTVKITLTVVGALLPWLVVIVPLWLLVAFLLRRGRARSRTVPPSPLPAPLGAPQGPPEAHGSERAGGDGSGHASGEPEQEAGANPSGRP